ncbi:glycosyltransferase family 4 protein [Photobacterium sp. DA100]|uniref:glycosyltransferase family 4 protein n=1 Tax=Photobacterium sp. DA100 TaxID=3027472 RepID=UPI00247A71A2|nr:glycosyltransferase family 4 protein [Photobacterium sp. DA100]WEM41553.1 glycosyltransferase family 4 protein [Photobacterium sp. DA100]
MANIVISANTSWYLYNFRKNTILALINAGHSVTAVSPTDGYSDKIEELGATFHHIDIDQGGTNPIRDFITFVNFVKIYKKNKYDVILNFTPKNNIYSTLAGRLLKVKVINNIAGLGSLFINESITSKIARSLYKLSQKHADWIFFQNNDDLTLFLNNGIADESLTERLPGSGVDLCRFSVKPADDDGVIRFLLIARMLREKGVLHYVEAARVLRARYGVKVEFNLLGFLAVNNPSAISEPEMQSWVEEGIVNYLGVSDSVEQEIARVNCMVLPSYYREGVPKSLLEAGAMGKIIVTTDNVGCKETVDDGINGFICQPKSTDSLVDALDKVILLSSEEREAMGLASRYKIEREFDEKLVIDKYLSRVEMLLS